MYRKDTNGLIQLVYTQLLSIIVLYDTVPSNGVISVMGLVSTIVPQIT